jgi:hypothetical protein
MFKEANARNVPLVEVNDDLIQSAMIGSYVLDDLRSAGSNEHSETTARLHAMVDKVSDDFLSGKLKERKANDQ